VDLVFNRIPTEAEKKKIDAAFNRSPPVAKKKRGRPVGSKNSADSPNAAYAPSSTQRNEVIMMSTNGIKPHHQAEAIGVSMKVLQKHFKHELAFGKLKANTKVSNSLYQKALEGNVPAMIFWLKSQAGWREADRLELTGANGKSLGNLTDTDKEQRMLSVLMKAKGIKPSASVKPVEVLYGSEEEEE
tara:strand:+ start:319 stop:879 length:561 start_codon:yes stop_codon:yes gene_type:complete